MHSCIQDHTTPHCRLAGPSCSSSPSSPLLSALASLKPQAAGYMPAGGEQVRKCHLRFDSGVEESSDRRLLKVTTVCLLYTQMEGGPHPVVETMETEVSPLIEGLGSIHF